MHAATTPDAALIDASLHGDRTAFAQIVERYQRAVYAVSYSSVRDRALTDDIAQDTFVIAWRRLGELRESEQLPAWLCGIARNLARDARKLQQRDRGGDISTSAPAGNVEATATPFDLLSDAESERAVSIALAKLPDVYREPLVLFYYEHQSTEAVARILGISATTTNKRLSRGRQQLAEHVAAVERAVARCGPKRGLAASVLALIGVSLPASRAEASPGALKGSIMKKLALSTVLVTVIGGTGLLIAGGRDRSTPPAPGSSSSRTGAAPSTNTDPWSAPSTVSAHARSGASAPAAPGRVMRPPTLPAAVTTAVPDCDAVAQHIARLELGGGEAEGSHVMLGGKRLPEEKRAALVGLVTRRHARACREEAWSENLRRCIAASDDRQSRSDCREVPSATAEELAAMPRELRCEVIAGHIAELVTIPGGEVASSVTMLSGQTTNPSQKMSALAQLRSATREDFASRCERGAWALNVRRCIAQLKTADDMDTCL